MSKPLAIDLFCGLGGWTEGLLAEGYHARGYDIEAHEYGDEKYPGELILADVMTLHGSQFADAALIVASPPCQEFSYMAMPWSRAKQIAAALRGKGEFPEGYRGSRTPAELTALFDACFRIQREASAAAGRHIPMVVENVRGAVPWVGPAAWNYGSYYLWGDVPALMPATIKAQKFNPDGAQHGQGSWFAIADSKNRGTKNPGFRFDGSGRSFQTESVARHVDGRKTQGQEHRRDGAPHTRHLTHPTEGRKHHGDWFRDPDCPSRQGGMTGRKQPGIGGIRENGKGDAWFQNGAAAHGSRSPARKAASAKIAKIPLPLSSWIARTYKPEAQAA